MRLTTSVNDWKIHTGPHTSCCLTTMKKVVWGEQGGVITVIILLEFLLQVYTTWYRAVAVFQFVVRVLSKGWRGLRCRLIL